MKISPEYDLSAATWRKSSYSDGSGGNCLEVGADHSHIVPVRDSKDLLRPALVFRAGAWSAFVAGVKNGQVTAA
ncbi:DUF397 domain-containing protein [Streptomyces sp. ISL-96]|uniref:DUF397 domain-containing protein n=1 Tax=Streptomyces sp. ISL-96 TaxID=2819191 RepID=UPI001BEA70C1|nr:DUF397 domain-containing protein [Streptomyces sp. ISL-96]MBT2491032.1 DUF397 domain-containing protein [Streptomyces sp. ISL-96]